VLERTSVLVTADTVEARFTVALPAQGRSVLGTWAAQVLTSRPPIVTLLGEPSLCWRVLSGQRFKGGFKGPSAY
jgi:hypothetical protein